MSVTATNVFFRIYKTFLVFFFSSPVFNLGLWEESVPLYIMQ